MYRVEAADAVSAGVMRKADRERPALRRRWLGHYLDGLMALSAWSVAGATILSVVALILYVVLGFELPI
jgi:hypothetical protein